MELDDKQHFLAQCPPFDALEAGSRDRLLRKLAITYEKAGTVFELGALPAELCLLRTGSVEVKTADGDLCDRLSSGECFGHPIPNLNGKTLTFLEDSLLFRFPGAAIDSLAEQDAAFGEYFHDQHAQRLHASLHDRARDARGSIHFHLNQSVQELMIPAPLCAHESVSITEASQQMSAARVSSILVVKSHKLCGILTDRDLRSRVLAKSLDPSHAVGTVMTHMPRTIAPTQTIYEAQLLMMSANIHHLPVVEQDRPVGILTVNDFIRAQNSEPVFMIQAINRAGTREALAHISQQLPELIVKMIRANVRADETGRIITSITDSMTRRLIKLASDAYGEAPCDYAWVVFGSQARQDQMLGSDQDNGLILSNDFRPEYDSYFKKLCQFVNEGLDKAGLRFCPGDIMAMTDKWRQPLSQWQQYFLRWIREPEPKALMHASIFYDQRHVAGQRALTQALNRSMLEEAGKNTIFQACMSENALQSTPPLGFFKTFVLEKDGNHNPVLDLKHRGTAPIVALVRLYCLARGIAAINTIDRLKALQADGLLSRSEASNLADAHEFIAALRLESQSEAMLAQREVTNNLNPNELSPLVRHQLKDAFSVVAESQRLLKMRFGHGSL